MDEPMTNEQINQLIQESASLLDEVLQIHLDTNIEENQEVQQQRYADWLEIQNQLNDESEIQVQPESDQQTIVDAIFQQIPLMPSHKDVLDKEPSDSSDSSTQTEIVTEMSTSPISKALKLQIDKISSKLELQAESNLLQDDDYRVLLTEIKNAPQLTKTENQIVDQILQDDYFSQVSYPQPIDSETYLEQLKNAKIDAETQSLLSNTSTTTTQITLQPPPLSGSTHKIWTSISGNQIPETIQLSIPDINGQPDYIRIQRRDRKLETHLKNVDFCIQQVQNDTTVLSLNQDQIRGFLVDFYANPQNLENLPNFEGEMQLSGTEKLKLNSILESVNKQAKQLSEQMENEFCKPVLGDLINDFQVQNENSDKMLEEFQKTQTLEEMLKNNTKFVKFEKEILDKTDLIEKKRQALAPGRKNDQSPRQKGGLWSGKSSGKVPQVLKVARE
ncbi:hypothetical protein SS50377_28026 [Spironucleus salmonicida]|uniref:Uncharacterized protein n=1 Tax=Spironucleus salmonicida TaxID=348837 RepID=V6LDM3_9EUKA|nr:hypothetical protein SS50377_28026 [Spironucleus salmonicida]|eukprot:EST42582.1 hypothetical protein SS50377_17899 [Spironucleus salmonicida]